MSYRDAAPATKDAAPNSHPRQILPQLKDATNPNSRLPRSFRFSTRRHTTRPQRKTRRLKRRSTRPQRLFTYDKGGRTPAHPTQVWTNMPHNITTSPYSATATLTHTVASRGRSEVSSFRQTKKALSLKRQMFASAVHQTRHNSRHAHHLCTNARSSRSNSTGLRLIRTLLSRSTPPPAPTKLNNTHHEDGHGSMGGQKNRCQYEIKSKRGIGWMVPSTVLWRGFHRLY